MAPLSSFSPSIWRPWRFLPWSPCLHLKLHGASLVRFSVNLAPMTFSSLEPLLALETAWHPSRPFLRQFGAPDVFFPGAPACTWNCMALLSSFSPSIWRPWRFLPWSPSLHLKLHGAPLVLFSVNLAPLTFSYSFLHLNSISRKWSARAFWGVGMMGRSIYFFFHLSRRYHAFFPLQLQGRHCRGVAEYRRNVKETNIKIMHLKLRGTRLVLFSVNLAHLTFSSLEPLLALETSWHPSRPFLRQFGAPDVFFPGTLLALETAWRFSRPFLREFGAPDVFFPGAPACPWNCMAPLSSVSPSIWRPWRFLPWSPCLHLKLHGTPLVRFSVNLAPLTFSSLEPLLALETAWRFSRPFLRQSGAHDVFFPGAPAGTWNCMAPLSSYWFNLLSFFFSFLLPLSSLFSFLFPSFLLFSSFLPSLFLSLSFFLSFWRPFGDPGGPRPPKPPQDTPLQAYILQMFVRICLIIKNCL